MSLPELSKSSKTVSSLLLKVNKNMTKEQANNLASIKLSDGDTLLTMEDSYFLYEISWLFKEVGYEKTYNFLNANWERILGSYNIRKKILFENPLFEKTKDKFIADMDIFKNTVQVEAGEKCKKCGSEETMSVVSQVARCDEQQTIRLYCLQCKNKWRAQ